jgi:hypothetical protein
MRKLGVVCILACSVIASVLPAAVAAPRAAASIRIVSTSPVRVVGRHFRAYERVRVTLRSDVVTRTRATTTNATGGFTVVVGTIPGGDPCGISLEIIAVGSAGDRAVTKAVPRECPPSP